MGARMIKKGLAVAVILLFIGVAFAPTFSSSVTPSTTITYDGSLSGYVKNTNMDPIDGARVRVYFHGTYEEDYTDSSGYYHVTNIPICYCLKNCTASKEGYKTEWVLLSIDENTTYDFVLTSFTEPELEITDILGGFGVTALIAARNISAETLHWSFTFDGGIILLPVGRIKEGTSHCYAESEATTFVLGIGMVDITVFVEARGEANVTKTVSGLVLGPFVIMQQE
jgi:hypothetical protein